MLPPESLYPKALTYCAAEPALTERVDKTKPRPSKEQAIYLGELRDSYVDCHDKVDSWAERRAKYVKQFEAQTYNWFERMYRAATGAASKD